MDINLDIDVEKLIEEKKLLIGNQNLVANFTEVFRVNFKAFEKLILFYKVNKKYAQLNNESAFGEIKKILHLKGFIKSVDDISDEHIANLMSRIRKEKGVRVNKARVTKPVASVTPTAKTPAPTVSHAVVSPVPEAVQVEGEKDLSEFLDTTWLDEEPEDWSIYFRSKKRPTEWNREFENLWRWILKKAPRYGMSTFDVGTYSAYRKHWDECSELFYDLSKCRREIGLNPKGVGKQ